MHAMVQPLFSDLFTVSCLTTSVIVSLETGYHFAKSWADGARNAIVLTPLVASALTLTESAFELVYFFVSPADANCISLKTGMGIMRAVSSSLCYLHLALRADAVNACTLTPHWRMWRVVGTLTMMLHWSLIIAFVSTRSNVEMTPNEDSDDVYLHTCGYSYDMGLLTAKWAFDVANYALFSILFIRPLRRHVKDMETSMSAASAASVSAAAVAAARSGGFAPSATVSSTPAGGTPTAGAVSASFAAAAGTPSGGSRGICGMPRAATPSAGGAAHSNAQVWDSADWGNHSGPAVYKRLVCRATVAVVFSTAFTLAVAIFVACMESSDLAEVPIYGGDSDMSDEIIVALSILDNAVVLGSVYFAAAGMLGQRVPWRRVRRGARPYKPRAQREDVLSQRRAAAAAAAASTAAITASNLKRYSPEGCCSGGGTPLNQAGSARSGALAEGGSLPVTSSSSTLTHLMSASWSGIVSEGLDDDSVSAGGGPLTAGASTNTLDCELAMVPARSPNALTARAAADGGEWGGGRHAV